MSAHARFKALHRVANRPFVTTPKDEEQPPHSALWGTDTFGQAEMKSRLPKDVYKKLQATAHAGKPLDASIAPEVAHAMKEWAISKGATHYTHWFQPMNGVTAEKHDSFLTFDGEGGVIERFNARELVQSEPDASSFPSGGLRATFEARGYTAWDPGTPAFLGQGPDGRTLCIPSVFISYTGECLDQKAPLLRSMRALSEAAVRVLRVLGDPETDAVITSVGPEQEYFLVDRNFLVLRPDLMASGRTLLGAPPAKGQQLEDQYFGAVPARVMAVMREAERRLVALGVPVKTRHNEVAPQQFESAPIYETSNRAADHNLMTLHAFSEVAKEHGMVLLSHEKPFAGINGSGKHNNWSMATPAGENLLEPGNTPRDNVRFLVFLLATLRAVHQHNGLLRASVASASNDHRLGANEAPPAIMSAFLGDELSDVLERIEKGTQGSRGAQAPIDLGVHTLPMVAKDNTDRNRTSPFAFTGNKFEFRAVGASANISWPNTVLNTIVTESLDWMAEAITKEKAGGADLNAAVARVLQKTITEVRPIIFNGDNYTAAWHAEAEKRGLRNDRDTPTALKQFKQEATQKLFDRYKVLSASELASRYHIMLETYTKMRDIEADVMADMIRTGVLPVAVEQLGRQAAALASMQAAKLDSGAVAAVADGANALGVQVAALRDGLKKLETAVAAAEGAADAEKQAEMMCHNVLPIMEQLREAADQAEALVDDGAWPYPKYREMLFTL